MIKTNFKFFAGFIVGAISAFFIAYAFGYAMDAMQINLYDSEADQQRNFNIILAFMLLVAVLSGHIATKIGRKGSQTK